MATTNNTFIRSDGTISFTGNQSMGGNRITELADPVNLGDAVNLRTLEESATVRINTIGNRYIAGESISSHQAVIMDSDGKVYNADSSDITHMGKVIGITTSSQTVDQEIPIVSIGTIDGFTGLSVGVEYFISSSGAITNVPPTTGFTQIIGLAVSSTKLLVNIQSPIGI